MIPIYARMIMTALLSLTAVILFLIFRTSARRDCMTAMLLSSVGDMFMVNVFGLGQFSTYIGAAMFIAAHIVYGGCFLKLSKATGKKYINSGFIVGLVIMIASALLLGVLAFTVPAEPKPIMFALILIYIAAIAYNVCGNFSYGFNAKGIRLILPAAVLVFYVTDVFIFFDMLGINSDLRQFVWYAYPLAQLALILFNSEFKRKAKV